MSGDTDFGQYEIANMVNGKVIVDDDNTSAPEKIPAPATTGSDNGVHYKGWGHLETCYC